MNHESNDLLFEKYMNGELDAGAQAEFEAHILNCPECAEKYADFMNIKRGLSSIGDEPLPDGFREKWSSSIHVYGRGPGRPAKRIRRILPAIAAGVAVVAVVSAVALSGVFSQGNALPEAMIARSAESEAADTTLQGGAAKDAAGADEAMPAPENDSSASLFMMQEAPMESAAASSEAGGGAAAITLYVPQATLDALADGLMELKTQFCLDEGLLIFTVTEENQSFFADFSKRYELGVSPIVGETYEIWVSG